MNNLSKGKAILYLAAIFLAGAVGGTVVGYASGHRKLVYRFGRFPHRNRILGRASSPEEEALLASGENGLREATPPRPPISRSAEPAARDTQ